jgi:hypothetical protein
MPVVLPVTLFQYVCVKMRDQLRRANIIQVTSSQKITSQTDLLVIISYKPVLRYHCTGKICCTYHNILITKKLLSHYYPQDAIGKKPLVVTVSAMYANMSTTLCRGILLCLINRNDHCKESRRMKRRTGYNKHPTDVPGFDQRLHHRL